ncbi:Phthalate dioxygenase reductase [Delftia tsuruhatensis]|uniref:PDR/VanB family oxidoreductase n=1 Tax=Delftia tsuruhatensis TaxID=180282 RepID=UPI001E6F2443|nr:PDR/VanB family oxidoreductase [Delftia tsuruhatensis]CAB5717254.1 Phthalate dioxygenase reductase [Delftia tsuruhatensis]CAC9684091.1 Phthalate dioxygenase reductase [Delftia tsuruhatensis]
MKVKLARKTDIAQDIASFELVHPDAAALPAFSAGAHITVHLPDVPCGPQGLSRQYSLYNCPSETHRYQIAVLKTADSRGGSAAMHALAAGDTLEISEPRNQFPLAPQARHCLLLAGGIGVTPLMSMAKALVRQGASFEMHYCARSAQRMAFRQDLERDARCGLRVHLYFDDGPLDQCIDLPRLLEAPGPGRHLYVCGPTGFMDAALAQAARAGWPQARLHSERFSAAPSLEQEPAREFTVELRRSRRRVVIPKDRSVAEALLAAGVDLPTSCNEGVCGTCITPVLSGEPDHRDHCLSEEEKASNAWFTPCCSRAKTALLVLDL